MRTELEPRLWSRTVLGAPLVDVVLAVAMASVGLFETAFGGLSWIDQWRGEPAVNAVVVTASILALAWRRVAPMTVLVVVLGGFTGLSVVYGATEAAIVVFAAGTAIYSAAAYARSLAWAAVVGAVGVVVRDLHDPALVTIGDRVWSPVFATLAFLVGVGARLHARKVAMAEETAGALQREQAELVAAVVEDERRRIARELHDVVSHSLGLVVLQAGAAEQVLDDPEKMRTILQSVRASGMEAIGEMGTLLDVIRADPGQSRLPLPSLDDLPSLVSHLQGTGADVRLRTVGAPRRLPAALELSAFRIAQEGLTNSLKHAAATRIDVTVRYGDHDVEVEVVDDGVGGGSSMGNRRGLAGMRERVAVFGGEFWAGPCQQGGWSLLARLPVAR